MQFKNSNISQPQQKNSQLKDIIQKTTHKLQLLNVNYNYSVIEQELISNIIPLDDLMKSQVSYQDNTNFIESHIFKIPFHDSYFMVVIPQGKKLSMSKLLKETRYNQLLAQKQNLIEEKPELIKCITKCNPNLVPPIGSLFHMKTYIDRSLCTKKVVQFKLGDERHVVTLSGFDYLRVSQPQVIDLIESEIQFQAVVNQIEYHAPQAKVQKGPLMESQLNFEIPDPEQFHVLCATTPSVEGYRVTKTIGLVQGQMVSSRHLFSDIFSSIKGMFGGEISGYTKMLETARTEALKRCLKLAKEKGANAILSLRFETSQISTQAACECLCYGTAAIIEKKEE